MSVRCDTSEQDNIWRCFNESKSSDGKINQRRRSHVLREGIVWPESFSFSLAALASRGPLGLGLSLDIR